MEATKVLKVQGLGFRVVGTLVSRSKLAVGGIITSLIGVLNLPKP